jgi:tetratricopeptide (TPR) repeat protein
MRIVKNILKAHWALSTAKFILLSQLAACASGREFWNFVVEEPVRKPMARESGEVETVNPNQQQAVKVTYNDGSTSTQVEIPVLSSGQQIVIDHKGRPSEKSIGLVPLPPSESDKSLEDAYLNNGNSISQKAPPVSIVKTRSEIQKLAKQGNYSLALEYATQLLQRYPNHAETLRTKGALLLKMGEREAALEAYQKAQDVAPNSRVAKQIEVLKKEEDKNR